MDKLTSLNKNEKICFIETKVEGDCELRLYDPKTDALNSFNLNGDLFSLIEVKLERRDGKQNSRTDTVKLDVLTHDKEPVYDMGGLDAMDAGFLNDKLGMYNDPIQIINGLLNVVKKDPIVIPEAGLYNYEYQIDPGGTDSSCGELIQAYAYMGSASASRAGRTTSTKPSTATTRSSRLSTPRLSSNNSSAWISPTTASSMWPPVSSTKTSFLPRPGS